jgi:hypothetical protein
VDVYYPPEWEGDFGFSCASRVVARSFVNSARLEAIWSPSDS